MGAIADLSALVNRLTGGNNGNPESIFYFKHNRIGGVSALPTIGRWVDLWQYDGMPSGGSKPSLENPTRATAGSLGQANPTGGRQKWLLSAGATSLNSLSFVLHDRLMHSSGFSGTVTTAQPVNGGVTRFTSGIGNLIELQVYTTVGTTGVNVTASYVDDQDVTRTTQPITIGGTGLREIGRAILLPLAQGSKGVKSVNSVTLAASTGTAGEFGVNIIHPVAFFAAPLAGAGAAVDFISGEPASVEIPTDACLNFLVMSNQTTFELFAQLSMVEA